MKRWMVLFVAALLAAAAWALPTVEQVQAEVAKGNYAGAEVLMRDVVAERPDSARAQYVLAEILAHNGRIDDARAAAKRARELDPAIRFTTREKFEDFERALAQAGRPGTAVPGTGAGPAWSDPPGRSGGSGAPAAPAVGGSGLPAWAWGLGGAVIVLLLWRMRARRRAAASAAGWAGQPGAPGAPGQAGRSGLLGAGLAGAGGFAAGMLAERLLRGSDSSGADGSSASALDDGGDELSRRSIDFGAGSDDWGSDAGGSDGGGSDGGGGDW